MKLLKYVHTIKEKPFVSTLELWNGFDYKSHEWLKRVIKKHESEFLERGILDTVESSIKGRGQPEKSYLLNERQFILLCLLVKNTPNSIKIKSSIETEFSYLRKLLLQKQKQQFDLEWNATRDIGKIARKGFTDCVLAVEELIRRQNPDSNYLKRKDAVYEAMTVSVYTGLGLNTDRVRLRKIDKKAKFRDSLGTRQLAILDFIEKLLPDMVKVMIVENANYKAVMAAIKSYAQQFRNLLDAPVSGTAVMV